MVNLDCYFQIPGRPLLPGQQGLREVRRSEKGGGPAEDEGEIQPEHSGPMILSDQAPNFVLLFFLPVYRLNMVLSREILCV